MQNVKSLNIKYVRASSNQCALKRQCDEPIDLINEAFFVKIFN